MKLTVFSFLRRAAAAALLGLTAAHAQVSLHGIYPATPISGVTTLFAVHDNNTTGVFVFDTTQQQVGWVETTISSTGAFSVSNIAGYAITGQLSAEVSGTTPTITGTLTKNGATNPINATRSALFGRGNGSPIVGRFEGIATKPGADHKSHVVFFIDVNYNLYFVHQQADGTLTGGTGTVTPNGSNNGGTFSASDVSGNAISGSFTATPLVISGTVTTVTGTYEFEATRIHALNRLGNISTRGFVGTGQDVLVGGFILFGGPKLVMIRVLGPSLAKFGITDALQAPVLQLNSGSTVLATNTGWTTAPNYNDMKGLPMAPLADGDSAILTTLEAGPYTTTVSGANGTTGVALVEVDEVLLD